MMGRTGAALIFLVLVGLTACGDGPVNGDVDVAEALQADSASGFARAMGSRRFSFPRDHGPHPPFRNEWWYLTGNLSTPDGRPFGFQMTLFRIALQPDPVTGESRWRARDIYMAHLALTDIQRGRFHASQRVGRAALGLAGAQTGPLRLWLEDWVITGAECNALPWTLKASTDEFGLALTLENGREPVLQGDDGLSRKSAEPGNASYYYSVPRLVTEGVVTVQGENYPVRGLSWLDREWSTSALAENQIGWDWFAIHLDDGTDLMYYRLRQTGGETDPHSEGTLVTAAGRRELDPEDVRLEEVRWWESPRGAVYPVAWRLEIPDAELSLRIEPRLDAQEQHGIVSYWEGAVAVTGTHGSEPVEGLGYAELTGYARGR